MVVIRNVNRLACCVPYLQLDFLPSKLNGLNFEVNADC